MNTIPIAFGTFIACFFIVAALLGILASSASIAIVQERNTTFTCCSAGDRLP